MHMKEEKHNANFMEARDNFNESNMRKNDELQAKLIVGEGTLCKFLAFFKSMTAQRAHEDTNRHWIFRAQRDLPAHPSILIITRLFAQKIHLFND